MTKSVTLIYNDVVSFVLDQFIASVLYYLRNVSCF